RDRGAFSLVANGVMHRAEALCYAAAAPGLVSGLGASVAVRPGTRMFVPQLLHRTVLPRQEWGTASTLRQVRLGHMMRMLAGKSFGIGPASPGPDSSAAYPGDFIDSHAPGPEPVRLRRTTVFGCPPGNLARCAHPISRTPAPPWSVSSGETRARASSWICWPGTTTPWSDITAGPTRA